MRQRDETVFMRLAPSLAVLAALLLIGTTPSFAEDSAPLATQFDKARKLVGSLAGKKLPKPESFGETELDLFDAMASGVAPVDPAFCERIKLIEITDDLLPVLQQPAPAVAFGIPDNVLNGNLLACRLFSLRGQLLCQQGKVAEGQAWMMKPRQMARRSGNDQSLIHLLTAIAMDAIGQQAAANYAEVWSESDRLAYTKASESLGSMGDLRTALRQDQDTLPANLRIRTLITTFKPLTPAQQKEHIEKLGGDCLGKDQEGQVRDRRYQALIANLTTESWDALLARMATELTPLNTEKIKAFATRNAEAMKQVEAEEAKPTAPSEQKAEFLYRVIMGPGIAGVASSQLNLELKAKLLALAMRKGTALTEADFADLRTADGKALKFGQYEGVKAIVAPDTFAPLLVIGPVK
jgi:hypothetical protein